MEQKFHPKAKQPHTTFVDKSQSGDHFFSIIFNIAILIVIIKIVNWDFDFITADFKTAQYFLIPLTSLQIMISIAEYILHKKPHYKHILKIINYTLGLMSILVLFKIFPFDVNGDDLAGTNQIILKSVLGGLAAVILGIVVVNLIKLPKYLEMAKEIKKVNKVV